MYHFKEEILSFYCLHVGDLFSLQFTLYLHLHGKILHAYIHSFSARPGDLERKGTRVNMVPIVPLQPGQKVPKDNSPRKKLEDLV